MLSGMKTQPDFRVYNPDQLMRMPPDLAKWLPEDHLVYFIREVIGRLGLCAFCGTGLWPN